MFINKIFQMNNKCMFNSQFGASNIKIPKKNLTNTESKHFVQLPFISNSFLCAVWVYIFLIDKLIHFFLFFQ